MSKRRLRCGMKCDVGVDGKGSFRGYSPKIFEVGRKLRVFG